MKKWLACAVVLSSLLFLCGCTAKQREKNLAVAIQTREFCSSTNTKAKEGCFSIERYDDSLYPSSERHQKLFPYPVILCTLKGIHLDPGTYVLYCPDTGCPFQPEFAQELVCNPQGEIQVSLPELNKWMPGLSIPLSISLWGVPGFCSDWYLFGKTGIYHATWTHQPIIAKSKDGKELHIRKKESGGNILEVGFKNFSPNETISFSSNSEGETFTKTVTMDTQGEFVYQCLPQVVGQDHGHVIISVSAGNEIFKASCDWDQRTLSIRRKQPQFMRERKCPE